jgi:hypothetical protein
MARLTLGTIALLIGCALGPPVQAQGPMQPLRPDGPLFTPEDMRRGIAMTERDCAAYSSTVYVVASGTGLCFRYYLSTSGGSGAEVVYFLQGDHPDDKLAYNPTELGRAAERMSIGYRRPAVYLARMGTDGSSGSERNRRTWLEVEATHLAIDAINARHGFRMIHVMGQSGGGHLTGSLVGTRRDIGCAIPGSGRLAFDQDYADRQARRPPEARHYSPDTALGAVVGNSARTRILVVTDPHDRRVPAHMQTGFVQAVQQGGGRIAQFFVAATDPLSHGVTPYVRRAMAGCLAGRSDDEIRASLDQMSRERWAAKIAAEHRQGGSPQSGTAYPTPAVGRMIAAGPALLR